MQLMPSAELVFKIIFVGDSGVGKTCVIYRFCRNSFRTDFATTIGLYCTVDFNRLCRGRILKVPRKILGKLFILGATDTQVATSSRGYSTAVEHCANRPINSVQRSNRKLYSSSSN